MMPEHCLQRIFLPASEEATLVCHWQLGHFAAIMLDGDDSETCPSTIGAAAFFGAEGSIGALVLAGAVGFGGGVNWAVELGAGAGARTGAGSAAGAGAGAATWDEVVAGPSAFLPRGMGFPHFGHLTSVGIRFGEALIFSFALQLAHSTGIRSMINSLGSHSLG